ncbi:MAG: hypothetical protein EXX96DRAFT_576920 [Benjaminiella poitrasii]|nr:MAG: hypothetical protein EXX96DRAFT_576920 [Benjaminiella poitrasii]
MSTFNVNVKSKRNKINVQINASDVASSSDTDNNVETTRPTKKMKKTTIMPDENDKVLVGFEKSVASMIKKHAHTIYEGKSYHKLNDSQKNSISNAFNSILDLTDNDTNDDSQRSLFTDSQWLDLKRLMSKQKTWTPLDNAIQKKLKIIETLAVKDIQAAYRKCLESQITYAMTENETYFEIYAFLLKILHEKSAILNSASKEKLSEGDYVITLWSRILSAIFEDKSHNMFCKWGDTVPEESSAAKKQDINATTVIGDKIDLRVCTSSPSGKIIDLLSVEFAKDSSSGKFFADHRKVLREAKANADRFYRSPFLNSKIKKNTRGHCIQIAGPVGQMLEVALVDNGLYAASHLGSLRLPSTQMDLRYLRTLLERLLTVKNILLTQKRYYELIEHSEQAAKKSMESKLNMDSSPYSPSSPTSSPSSLSSSSTTNKYISWVRGTWFPPSIKKDTKCSGVWHESLFSPPK